MPVTTQHFGRIFYMHLRLLTIIFPSTYRKLYINLLCYLIFQTLSGKLLTCFLGV